MPSENCTLILALLQRQPGVKSKFGANRYDPAEHLRPNESLMSERTEFMEP